jgi:hypothetical protein
MLGKLPRVPQSLRGVESEGFLPSAGLDAVRFAIRDSRSPAGLGTSLIFAEDTPSLGLTQFLIK